MAVSTWIFVASTALVIGHVFGMIGGDPCSPNPCGQNTQCYVSSGRPVCSCMPGHWGNPLSYCQRGECQDSNDCPGHRVCRDYQCVDSCAGVCGVNADCQVRSHVPVCTCPSGYTGDPSSRCRLMDPQELCRPSPCGANTNCMVINGTPTCTCLPSYVGSPLQGCRHECDSDYDCPASQSCQNYKCVSACTSGVCAPTANCAVSNHRAVCSCPAGYLGDPYVSCHAECLSHGDCPPGRPSCLNAKCVDPCAGVCGVNANCRVRDGTTAVCSCPRHMTGDPFVSCRPFEKTAASTVRSGVLTMSQGRCSLRPPVPASATDLCVPSPCGTNARCEPGHDRSGKERPVCTCLPGHLGDPLVHCRRGECASDAECRADQNCLNYNCVSSCSNQCGVGAACNARNHVAVCSCPAGHTGDALTRCYPVPAPVARAFYSKK